MTPRIIIFSWFLAALAAGASGVLSGLRPPFPQVLLGTLTLALVAAYVLSPRFKAWASAIPVRSVLVFHLSRFVGVYFLWEYGNGRLPYAFAVPGGIGDIVVASAACVLLRKYPPSRPLLFTWNLFGLIDILFVVASAARCTLLDPPSMHAMLELPLNLLLTFVVPVIIASHLLVFEKLAHGREAS